jgi:hypothetical protein
MTNAGYMVTEPEYIASWANSLIGRMEAQGFH